MVSSPAAAAALQAAEPAMRHAARGPEEIGAVLVCTCTSTRMIPSVATWISGQLGIFQTHASCDIVAGQRTLPIDVSVRWRKTEASCRLNPEAPLGHKTAHPLVQFLLPSKPGRASGQSSQFAVYRPGDWTFLPRKSYFSVYSLPY